MVIQDLQSPKVWAHRGRNRIAPENTLPAFRYALDAGDHGLELDVALSADGIPVIIHDDTLDRTTDGSGPVADITAMEIAQLDAGRWFDASFAGTRVPTLEEVFVSVGGRIAINVELKESGRRSRLEDSIEAKVAALVEKFGLGDSVLISSFDWSLLERYRKKEPQAFIGVLAEPRSKSEEAFRFALAIEAYSIHPHVADLTDGQWSAYRRVSPQIFPYTVADQRQAEVALDGGVHGFFADLPFDD